MKRVKRELEQAKNPDPYAPVNESGAGSSRYQYYSSQDPYSQPDPYASSDPYRQNTSGPSYKRSRRDNDDPYA